MLIENKYNGKVLVKIKGLAFSFKSLTSFKASNASSKDIFLILKKKYVFDKVHNYIYLFLFQ